MDQKNQDKIMGLNAIILQIDRIAGTRVLEIEVMVIVRLSLFVEVQIYFI